MAEDFLNFWCLCVHVLYFIWNFVMLATYHVRISTSHIYFYPALVFISSFIWSSFIYDLYSMCVYMCYFCMYILFCNRAPWKNSLTEWSNLYWYIWNKKWIKVSLVASKWYMHHIWLQLKLDDIWFVDFYNLQSTQSQRKLSDYALLKVCEWLLNAFHIRWLSQSCMFMSPL